jgi:hypothetical protein
MVVTLPVLELPQQFPWISAEPSSGGR